MEWSTLVQSVCVSRTDPVLPVEVVPGLVLLSWIVSAACAGLALQVARLSAQLTRARDRWIGHVTGGLCLGIGTWSMHFIGLMGWHVPADSTFSMPLTALSVLPGLLGAAGLLHWLQRRRDAAGDAVAALGWTAAVGTLHVLGMAAWHVDAAMRVHAQRLPVTLTLGAVLPWLALRLWRWTQRHAPARGIGQWAPSVVGGLALGSCGMVLHYGAMWSLALVGEPDLLHTHPAGDVSTWQVAVGLAVAVVLAALVTAMGMLLMVLREKTLQLRRLEAASNTFLRTAVDAVLVIDVHGQIRRVNPATERLFGWSEAELLGQPLFRLMRPDDAQAHDGHIARHLRTGERRIVGIGREVIGVHRDGQPMALRLSVGRADVDDDTFFVGLLTDIRREKALQAQREHELNHDLLTGLLNRRALFDRMPGLLLQACARRREVAVVYIDLDGFKSVNDTLGHEAGDGVLAGCAARMREVVREGDLVVRLGGDEFLVMMGDLPDGGQEVRRVADTLLTVLSRPLQLAGGASVQVGASLGIARCSPCAQPGQLANLPDWLMRQADAALYQSKRAGKGRWHEQACASASPALAGTSTPG